MNRFAQRHHRMQNINFTERSFGDKLIWFVLPLAFSSIIQQLFHSADTAVVGQFVGKEALAAVGSTAPIVNLFIEFFRVCRLAQML